MEKKFILAIDQSTSGTKAVLIQKDGTIFHRTTFAHKQHYPNAGWVEHDPKEIIMQTYGAIHEALEATGTRPEQIAAIGISNQRETVLIWDRTTGEPVYNAIVWQCQRAEGICREITDAGYKDIVRQKTGLILSPYFPAAKLKWIIDNVPQIQERALNGELLFGTIDTWVLWNMTGKKVHATDYSNASRTQLYNIHEKCWDKELFELFGIPLSMAPRVYDSNHAFGQTDDKRLFDEKITITGIMGDSHAALFAQNCFEKGMTKTTYGTGSSIMMNIGKKAAESKNGLVTSIGWSFDGEVEYVFEGNINCTGATVQWLVDELELIPDASCSETIAASVEDTGGVYLVPAFVGLGAPYWDSNARAVITGMSRGTKKAHIVRAALESIAYQIRDVVDLMVGDACITLKELRVDGGATKNSLLMQFQSDILNVSVVCTEVQELSAFGAGYMAGLKTGFWKDKAEIQGLRKIRAIYRPAMDKEKRKNLYNGWKQAVKRARF